MHAKPWLANTASVPECLGAVFSPPLLERAIHAATRDCSLEHMLAGVRAGPSRRRSAV